MINRIEYSIIDQCNLNCAYCSHYASICKTTPIDYTDFMVDIERLSRLTDEGRELGTLGILGGEPMLHKDWIEMCVVARYYLPFSRIRVTTNGTLIPKLTGQQLGILRRNDIEILISKYTNKINYKQIEDILNEYHIVWKYTQHGKLTNFAKYHLDEQGQRIPSISHEHCDLWQGTYTCHELRNGWLYPCSQIVRYAELNREFKTKFYDCLENCRNIHTSTLEQIEEFLKKPVPFCKFCKTEEWDNQQGEYRPSTKSKDEFI